MKACLSLLAVFRFMTLIAFAGDGETPSKFKITTKRETDKVEFRVEKNKTLFVVKSPFGISQVVIERREENWPNLVVLRLHLKGLSSFRATNAKVKLDAVVSVQDRKLEVRSWKDGKEDALLDEKSPLWMNVRVVDGDGNPAKEIPLKAGYFEVTLPNALFEGNPKTITLNWIDFYRN